MLNRLLIGVVVVAAVIGVPGVAAADPPPTPDINAFPSARPSDGVLDGVICVLGKQSGGYGCSGPLPAAPGAANLVSAGASGKPGFANAGRPL
jgi:hypothetical protein